MSEYSQKLNALMNRVEHPERYEDTEDVFEVMQGLIEWLNKHSDEADEEQGHKFIFGCGTL